MLKTNGFCEMSNNELYEVNGGIPPVVIVALVIFCVGGCAGACTTAAERERAAAERELEKAKELATSAPSDSIPAN